MTCDIGDLLKSIEKTQIWYINHVDHFAWRPKYDIASSRFTVELLPVNKVVLGC